MSLSNHICSISKKPCHSFEGKLTYGAQAILGPGGTSSHPGAHSVGYIHDCVVCGELVDSKCFRCCLLEVKFGICIILP